MIWENALFQIKGKFFFFSCILIIKTPNTILLIINIWYAIKIYSVKNKYHYKNVFIVGKLPLLLIIPSEKCMKHYQKKKTQHQKPLWRIMTKYMTVKISFVYQVSIKHFFLTNSSWLANHIWNRRIMRVFIIMPSTIPDQNIDLQVCRHVFLSCAVSCVCLITYVKVKLVRWVA